MMSEKFIRIVKLGENKKRAMSHCNKNKRKRKQRIFPRPRERRYYRL